MSYNKYTKYQIMDAKYNKNLVNEELLVQKLPLKVVDPQPPKWFQEFEKRNNERWDKQDKVNAIIFDFMEKQNNINLLLTNQIKELQTIPPKWFQEFEKRTNERFDKLETEVKGINTRIDNLVKLNNLKEQTTIGN